MKEERLHYICADRGSQRCPCHLMAAGQCYTCTMEKTGVCSCDETVGWQGVCPYTEYMQNGKEAAPLAKSVEIRIKARQSFGDDLAVICLEGGAGFAIQCQKPGAYIMADALIGERGWRTPLSVLATDAAAGTVDFLVRVTGPKTAWLVDPSIDRWQVTGPFYNGLLHSQDLKPEKKAFAIVRGTALAPYLCACQGLPGMETSQLYLDKNGLPEELVEQYLIGQPYTAVNLDNQEDFEKVEKQLQTVLRMGTPYNVMVLVSPYFAEKLRENLTEEEKGRLVVPNSANFCCGEGICGACSYTDKEGRTVRLCKCHEAVLE
ncbi:MAG: hypothetical protein HFE73_04275 [Firmicutes bacterium]|nr:hypothetical protein [Bacillota bacterium]